MMEKFVSAQFSGRMYAINARWWKEWCKYVNFQDLYLTPYFTNEKPLKSTTGPMNRKQMNNFNEVVKGRRPNDIKNM